MKSHLSNWGGGIFIYKQQEYIMKKIALVFGVLLLQACTINLYEVRDGRPELRNTYRNYYTPRYTPTYRYLDFYNRYDTRIIYSYPRYLGPVVRPERPSNGPRVQPKEDPRPPRRAVPRQEERPSVIVRPRVRPPVRDTIR